MRMSATRFEDLIVWQKAHRFQVARSQNSGVRMRMLEAYSRAILNSDS